MSFHFGHKVTDSAGIYFSVACFFTLIYDNKYSSGFFIESYVFDTFRAFSYEFILQRMLRDCCCDVFKTCAREWCFDVLRFFSDSPLPIYPMGFSDPNWAHYPQYSAV